MHYSHMTVQIQISIAITYCSHDYLRPLFATAQETNPTLLKRTACHVSKSCSLATSPFSTLRHPDLPPAPTLPGSPTRYTSMVMWLTMSKDIIASGNVQRVSMYRGATPRSCPLWSGN